jgi:ABC-type uncharacterized transport system permease subunit
MADVKKASALVVGMALGVGVITILVEASVRSREPERSGHLIAAGGTPAEAELLVGKPFAESLDLPVITDPPGGCVAIAEAPPDETMYCLDSVVENEQEAELLGMRVNGHMPTRLDERLVGLKAELHSLGDTPEDEVRRNDILIQIGDLMAQIEAQGDG